MSKMTAKIENVNGVYEIHANAEVFVIPNSANKVSEYTFRSVIDNAHRMCENLGMEFDEKNDKLAQFWTSSDDLDTENLSCHGFSFEVDGQEVYSEYIPECIPVKIYKDIKEGESREVIYEFEGHIYEPKSSRVPVRLVLNVTAAQSKYRYRRFGNFEDVLEDVGAWR